MAAGPGRVSREGVKIDMSVKIGDTVVIPEYGGWFLKIDVKIVQIDAKNRFRSSKIVIFLHKIVAFH